MRITSNPDGVFLLLLVYPIDSHAFLTGKLVPCWPPELLVEDMNQPFAADADVDADNIFDTIHTMIANVTQPDDMYLTALENTGSFTLRSLRIAIAY